jgi:hypothetical protein
MWLKESCNTLYNKANKAPFLVSNKSTEKFDLLEMPQNVNIFYFWVVRSENSVFYKEINSSFIIMVCLKSFLPPLTVGKSNKHICSLATQVLYLTMTLS